MLDDAVTIIERKSEVYCRISEAVFARKNQKHWRVYDVDEHTVAKVATNEWRAKNEYIIGSFLLKHKFFVPRMHGIIVPHTELPQHYVVMEKIHGTEICYLYYQKVFTEAIKQYKDSLERALDLGVVPF